MSAEVRDTEDAEAAMATVVGRSFSVRLGAQVLGAVVSVAGMAVLANTLAPAGYGEYTFYSALIPLIATLADLGVGPIVTREVARDRAAGARALGDALMLKGLLAVGLLCVAGLAAPLTLDASQALLIVLVTATATIDFSQDVGVWIFRANDRQDLEAMLMLLNQVVWLAGIGLCALGGAGLFWFVAAATVACLVRTVIGAWMVARFFYAPELAFDASRLRRLVSEGLPFGLAMLTAVFYGRLGVLLLKGMATASDVAFYNVGYMLSQPLAFVSSAFNVSVFPSLARTALKNPESVRALLRRAVKFQFLAGLPLSVGLFILAPRVVPVLLKGEDFRAAGIALRVVSAGLVLIFLNLMARFVLTALDSQRTYFRAIVAGLGANALVSAALIGHFGAAGACVGLLAGELTVLVLCRRALARWMQPGDMLRELGRPLLAVTAMGAVVFAMKGAPLPLVPVAGAAVYALAVVLVKALSPGEMRVLQQVYVSFGLPGSARLLRAADR